MSNLNLFLPIVKVDEAKRLVYGRIAHETVDHADEVFDYSTSKDNFVKWSDLMQKESGGKSFGNVRGMHGNIAAGKLTQPLQFSDAAKAIDAVVKVVDDNEWEKVLEGVYTGFSMGGSYARKWQDVLNGKPVTRYTANPNEVSLVDRPCIPTAKFFDIQKSDGSVLHKFFKAQPKSKQGGRFITNQASAEEKHAEHMEAALANGTTIAATLHHVAASHYKNAAAEYGKGNNSIGDAHVQEGDRIAVQAYGCVKLLGKSAEVAMLAGAVHVEASKGFDMPSGNPTSGIQHYDLEGAPKKPNKSDAEKALSSPSSPEADEDGRVVKSNIEDTQLATENDVKKDAITSEGNKRGASVTDGTAGRGPESANAAQGEPPAGGHGAEGSPNGKRKKPAADDMTDDEVDEACKMFKAHKAKEAADAQAATEERIAKSVTNNVLAALKEAGILNKADRGTAAKAAPADNAGKAPHLFAVNKDGSVAKSDSGTKEVAGIDPSLEKSHNPGKEDKLQAANLIKAAYAKPQSHDQFFKR